MTIVYLWTAVNAAGLVIQSFLIADSAISIRHAREEGLPNGARRRILFGHGRSGLCYWVVHSVFLYAGLRIIFHFTFGVVGELFIIAAVLLVIAGLADYRDRLILRRN